MNGMRALILLIVYAAFTVTPAFALHSCSEICTNNLSAHAEYPETGTSPAECAEKEVSTTQSAEHRAGGIIKLHKTSNTALENTTRKTISGHLSFYSNRISNSPFNHSQVPIYLRHCTYRL